MRGRLWEQPHRGDPVAIGQVMIGEGVGEVVASSDPALAVGETVRGYFGWQQYAAAATGELERIDRHAAPLSTALGVLGMPGLTAYYGLLEVGQPRAGETVVVTGAAGAVGSAVGQIAKIQGCRVVGICGTEAKCRHIVDDLGFDAAVNYRTESLDDDLAAACPDGIDVIFENVGGEILEAMLRQINLHGPHCAVRRDCPVPHRRAAAGAAALANPPPPPGAHAGLPGERLCGAGRGGHGRA